MLEFQEITLEHKTLFDRYIHLHTPDTSELTFTNFFMWKDVYRFRFTILADLLCVIAQPEEKEPYAFCPIGDLRSDNIHEAIEALKTFFAAQGSKLVFRRVSERELSFLRQYAAEEADIVPDRDNSDYVYSYSALVSLKGKKYDGKRNHINKFKKLYQFEYVPLEEEHIEECYEVLGVWCRERSCEHHKDLYCEKLANAEAIKNFKALGCTGALVRVDGKAEAFTLGEQLNDNTVVIHIEKANSKINGLFTFINQQFLEHAWQGMEFVNREQDLGIEGLRKAKESYHPVHMVQKYCLTCKM